ncbi:hypothetical protein NUW58_g7115 [Xylaria curta]|uniref:Uncharacterized protein n=1 Tax=Xylaria curta TaxID=42375 RepID=A0ACC1NMF1_9PEZI|nr:hypothetical protein NUW58_g7115 [Xylaria curta]
MGTPFIRLQEPNWLDGYDPNLPPEQQSTQVPCAIKDMMEVRVKVFVDEKRCPLKTQYDADDPRSCHWIMYASVNMTTKPEERDPETDRVIRPRRSETITMAIGALRGKPCISAIIFCLFWQARRKYIYIDWEKLATRAGYVNGAAAKMF